MLRKLAKTGKSILFPIVLLWTLCSSVLFCAIAMNIAGQLTGFQDSPVQANSTMHSTHCLQQDMAADTTATGKMPISSVDSDAENGCCDKDATLTNSFSNLLDLPGTAILLLLISFFFYPVRSRSTTPKSRNGPYYPPPLRVLFCAYLK